MLTAIQIACMTSKTRADYFGGKPKELLVQFSIHRQPRRNTDKDGTEPPRTREGKTHPGGRTLRRNLKRLAARRNGYLADRDYRAKVSPGTVAGLREPGSMTH